MPCRKIGYSLCNSSFIRLVILQPHPLEPVHALLVHHHESHNDGQIPQAVLKHRPRLFLPAIPPKSPRGLGEYGVRDQGRQCECPRSETRQGYQHRANGDKEESVTKRYQSIAGWGKDGKHLIPCLSVRAPHNI